MFHLSYTKKATESIDSVKHMERPDTDTARSAEQGTNAPEDTFSRFIIPVLVSVLFFLLARIFFVTSFPSFLLSEDQKFERFTEEVFRSEMNSNTLSRHYTIADPKNYGLDTKNVSLGNGSLGARKESCASAENYFNTLKTFDYEKLSQKHQLTYDIFRDYLETEMEGAAYLLYDEPLSPTLGIQAQLPVLLAEYTFRTKGDIEDYLALLSQIPDYFSSILAFEKAKAQEGLFMSNTCASEVVRQCQEFIADPESNYLIEIFDEKIDAIQNLTTDEKIAYKSRNKSILLGYMIPAYETMINAVNSFSESSMNPQGLYYYPQGTAYYRYLVKSTVGDNRPIEEIEESVKVQMVEDFSAIQELLKQYPQSKTGNQTEETKPEDEEDETAQGRITEADENDDESSTAEAWNDLSNATDSVWNDLTNTTDSIWNDVTDLAAGQGTAAEDIIEAWSAAASVAENKTPSSGDPTAMLNELRQKITEAFPVLPNVSCEVKYVHKSLQNHLSPAFYLTPAIDDYTNNVIYINPASDYNELELYTTLAHEGYPGHLYQSVYFCAQQPDLLRNLLDVGGYTEGWATYVEMYAYSFWEEDPLLAALSQRNRSFTLGLASLLDIGIHYRGYSLEQVTAFLNQLGFSSSTARSLYQAILEAPANYLQYYVGCLNFYELRDTMQETLGNNFSLREFHRLVMETGPAPFYILREKILATVQN